MPMSMEIRMGLLPVYMINLLVKEQKREVNATIFWYFQSINFNETIYTVFIYQCKRNNIPYHLSYTTKKQYGWCVYIANNVSKTVKMLINSTKL